MPRGSCSSGSADEIDDDVRALSVSGSLHHLGEIQRLVIGNVGAAVGHREQGVELGWGGGCGCGCDGGCAIQAAELDGRDADARRGARVDEGVVAFLQRVNEDGRLESCSVRELRLRIG